MGKGKGKDYKFRGRAVEGRGRTLSQALADLEDYWTSRPSLVMHDYGVIELQIMIGGTMTLIEVADNKIIDQVIAGNNDALVNYLAGKAGITASDMSTLLSQTSEVVATVDRIRPPSDPNFWKATSGTEPEVVLPTVIEAWAIDAVATKLPTPSRRQVMALIASIGQQEGKSLSRISREANIPQSTLRDAVDRDRKAREATVVARPRGKKLDESEKVTVARMYAESGNAAEVARKLNLSDRTVRGVVVREKEMVKELRRANVKDRLLDLVEAGMSASAAGRQLGMGERTARRWVAGEK